MIACGAEAKAAANWLNNEYFGRLNKTGLTIASGPVSARANAEIVTMVSAGVISSKTAKDVLEIEWREQTGAPQQIVESRGLKQVSDDSAIEAAVDAVIAANPRASKRSNLGPK